MDRHCFFSRKDTPTAVSVCGRAAPPCGQGCSSPFGRRGCALWPDARGGTSWRSRPLEAGTGGWEERKNNWLSMKTNVCCWFFISKLKKTVVYILWLESEEKEIGSVMQDLQHTRQVTLRCRFSVIYLFPAIILPAFRVHSLDLLKQRNSGSQHWVRRLSQKKVNSN